MCLPWRAEQSEIEGAGGGLTGEQVETHTD